ncbi:potassium transporter [Polychytrium aggregatum]|uniref:potassium transporter n=1 Tax=Polychytrium aggregatum TaxID=110093 RepID=UPI0022FDE862|nr:potassium transporter [Polychytrium aggregatum]KAI9204803.1 potassium transporter [Polychytrium aggregatum]
MTLWEHKHLLVTIGMVAAACLLSDGFIAPAITVVSAFEGVQSYIGADNLKSDYVVGIAIGILFVLLCIQRFGTSKVITFYGPIMVLWFLSIAAIGLYHISFRPGIFVALSPHWIVIFLIRHGLDGYWVFGKVVLAVTGVEAMYSDLGHFKTVPIRASFLGLVFPSLLLNYLGQAVCLLDGVDDASNAANWTNIASAPFFASVPEPVKWPVLILATLAAIIASQATISGCFTLIDQAISLSVFPNVKSIHTSTQSAGAVYIPFFNILLAIVSLSLLAIFRTSEDLSNIYGICVTMTMLVTSILYVLVMIYTWKYPRWKVALFSCFIFPLDILFLVATWKKIAPFGWVSLLISLFMFLFMYVWYTTTMEVNDYLRDKLLTMSELRQHVKSIMRTNGTIVYISNTDEDVPNVLNICAKRLNTLPTNIVCMSAISSAAPFIADEERMVFRTVDAAAGIYRLVISYGYAERSIDSVTALERAKKRGLRMKPGDPLVFVVGREIIASCKEATVFSRIRRTAYDAISRNTEGKIEYFNLPPNDTLEVSGQIVL